MPYYSSRHVIIALILAALAPVCRGTSVRAPLLADLVAQADCVVRGETIATRSEWRGEGPGRHIVTLVTVRVLGRIVGTAADTMDLEFLGGTLDGQTLTVTDQPRFNRGDRDILFVANNGRQLCPLVAMRYGRYPLLRDPTRSDRELVLRADGAALRSVDEVARPLGVSAGDKGGPSAQALSSIGQPLTAGEFESRIRQTAAALGRKDLAP